MKTPRVHGKTSSVEILGGASRPNNTGRRWAENYKRLAELREQFLRGRDAQTLSAKEELSWFSEHLTDAATDSYDRDCALALLCSTQNALYEIGQALERIKAGTYGICELSGETIEADRLKAIPWTRFSLAAQAQLEARRAGPRVQLGQLGTCLKSSDSGDTLEEDGEQSSSREPKRKAA